MSVLNKNVNFVLLILMIVLMVAFTGTMVYFQHSYQGMNGKYNTKIQEVESLLVALKSEQNTSAELHEAYLGCSNQTGEEQKGFNYVVTDLSKTKESLNQTLVSTKAILSDTRQKLADSEKNLQDAENNLEAAKSDLKVALDEKAKIKTLLDKDVHLAQDAQEDSLALKTAIENYQASDQTPPDCSSILSDLRSKAKAVDDTVRQIKGE